MNGLCADLLSLLTSQLDVDEYCLLLTATYDLKHPNEAAKTGDWMNIKYYLKIIKYYPKIRISNTNTYKPASLLYITLCKTSQEPSNIFQSLAFYNNKRLISELENHDLLGANQCTDILLGASIGGHIDLIDRYSVYLVGDATEIYHPCLARAITHKQIETILHLKKLYNYMFGTYFLAYGIIKDDMKLLDLIVNEFDIDTTWGVQYMIRQQNYDGIDYFLNKVLENGDVEDYNIMIENCMKFAERNNYRKSLEYLKSKQQQD